MNERKEIAKVTCADCEYARWAPKHYLNCYICENPRSDYLGEKMNGFVDRDCVCFMRKEAEDEII